MKNKNILAPLILFAFCGKEKDIDASCDSATLNIKANFLAVRHEALQSTPNAANPLLLDEILIIDPATGAYPLPASEYYPIKVGFLYNSVTTNYEVVEGTSTPDRFKQIIGKVIVTDSESAEGKANIKALNTKLYALVVPMKGVADPDNTFHVFGYQNGLKFLPEATAAEFGNRVVGSFSSLTDAEEGTPNGVNLLDTSYANTLALYNQRFDPVIVP